MKWLLPCLSLVSVVALGLADETKWTKVAPKDGKCEIEFPGKPTEKAQTKGSQFLMEALEGKAAYMLQFNELPSQIPIDNEEAVKKIFNGGQEGLMKAEGFEKSKIIKSDDGKFGKYPARDLSLEVPSLGVYKVKFILTGDKFYQVTAAGPKAFIEGDDVKKFMESFKLKD